MNFDTILVILFVIAVIIVIAGLYPYLRMIFKGVFAIIESISDFFHQNTKNNKYKDMSKKSSNKGYEIDPEEIKIDRNDLVVQVPRTALDDQLKVREVNQMYSDMLSDMNRKRPVTLWGQQRMIDKMRNQNIRIELTIDQIGLHNAMIKEAAKLEATIMHAPKLVEHELEMMLLDEKIEKDTKIHSFMDMLDEIDSRSKVRDIEIKIREAEHDRYLMETKLSEIERKANINMVLAKTDQEQARASLMAESLILFREGKLSEKLQAYLIVSVFNPGDQSYVDLGADEELQKILLRDKKYDADKKKWEVKSTRTDYKNKKEKLDHQRKLRKDSSQSNE